jgi:hypothetical protein
VPSSTSGNSRPICLTVSKVILVRAMNGLQTPAAVPAKPASSMRPEAIDGVEIERGFSAQLLWYNDLPRRLDVEPA